MATIIHPFLTLLASLTRQELAQQVAYLKAVKNVHVEAGFGPEPPDHSDTWSEFLRRHAETMWQCDFACKSKWTIKRMVGLYFLVFIHIGSRRIWISPCTANPTGEWTAQH